MSLVLRNDDQIDSNALAKTYTMDLVLQKKHIGMAIVDKKG